MKIFYLLLSAVINRRGIDCEVLKGLSDADWNDAVGLFQRQGVTAVAFEAVEQVPKALQPPLDVLMNWFGNAEMVDRKMRKMRKVAFEYADRMDRVGLLTYVLKGIGVSSYYPVPTHRECGDLDCFFINNEGVPAYETGNEASEKIGAQVMRDYYKHSHIVYNGLVIENHQFCTGIRGNKDRKAFERHLQNLLRGSGKRYVGDSRLLMPSADFTALFLTIHSLNHFLFEKIHFRHILDWAFFLKAEAGNVDWAEFWKWCERMRMTRFVACLNWICREKLGMTIDIDEPKEDFDIERLSERILADIFADDCCMTAGKSHLKELWIKGCGFFRSDWKHREVCGRSAVGALLEMALGYVLERKPKLRWDL